MTRPNRSQSGFTLLEAIVALAVLAMAAMALYGWLNSNLLILKRVDDVYQSVEAVESALEWVTILDPYEHPTGEQEIAGARVSWHFKPLGSSLPAKDMYGNLSVNDAQLFRAEIEIHRGDKRLARFEMLQLGLQAKRRPEELVF